MGVLKLTIRQQKTKGEETDRNKKEEEAGQRKITSVSENHLAQCKSPKKKRHIDDWFLTPNQRRRRRYRQEMKKRTETKETKQK